MPFINDPDGLSQGGVTSVASTTFASSAGAQTVITSINVPAVTAGDYLEVRDAPNADNNGLYFIDSTVASTSITATKQALTGAVVNPVDDAGAATVRIFGHDADEKNFYFDTANRLFTYLAGFGSITLLDTAGVLGQSQYSFMKEEWKNDNDLIKFPFPMTSIGPEQFEYNNWKPVDEADAGNTITTTPASDTRKLTRTAGWDEVDINGSISNQYFGFLTLGNIDSGDNVKYAYDNQSAATSTTFDGPANEAVQSITGFGEDPGAGYTYTADTFARTAGDFVADGYLVGDGLFIQNAQNPANNGTFTITGVVALAITVAGSPFTVDSNDTVAVAAIDRRTNGLAARIRVFGKTYGLATTVDIGVSALTNQVYRFPLQETPDAVIVDLALSETAGDIATLLSNITGGVTAPYNDMALGYFATSFTRSGFNAIAGDTPSPGDAQFGVLIEGDAGNDAGGPGSAEQIYAFVQAQLQLSTNINDPAGDIVGEDPVTLAGELAEPLVTLASTGNTLTTIGQISNPGGGGTGVAIDNFNDNDTNRLTFVDDDGDTRAFPFVAAGTINFNQHLSNDIDAIFRTFFTNDDTGDNTGRDFATIDAMTVQDNAGPSDIAGAVPQAPAGSSIAFNYDYDGNIQRGAGSEATDVPITIVAIGLSVGQYVVATGTIIRAVGQTFSLVASLERNFSNP